MILERVRLLSQQRLDLEDWDLLLSGHRTDSKYFNEQFFNSENHIVKGFTVTGIGLKSATINTADATLFFPENTADFSWFTMETGGANLTIPEADFTAASRNYVELYLLTENGTPATKTFWNPSANSGLGEEFNQQIDTVTSLTVQYDVSIGGFSGSADRLPLAIIDIDAGGNITCILDKRNLFFRLGTGSDPLNEFSWVSREEPNLNIILSGVAGTYVAGETVTFTSGAVGVVDVGGTTDITIRELDNDLCEAGDTLTGSTSGATGTVVSIRHLFTGGDSDIDDLKEMFNALMTEIKLLKGTDYWFQNPLTSLVGLGKLINSSITPNTANAIFSWTGTELSITDDSGAPADSDVIAYIRIFGSSQTFELTRQDAVSAALTIADGEVLYVTLPSSGDRTFSTAGAGATNYKVATRATYQVDDYNYWIAVREGSKLCIHGMGIMETGEDRRISDDTPEEILVDTISERTPANGVTIDGVSLKDTGVVADNLRLTPGVVAGTVAGEMRTDSTDSNRPKWYDGTGEEKIILQDELNILEYVGTNTNATDAKAFLDEIDLLRTEQDEPTGFVNRTDSTLSFVNLTRTFSIAPIGSFDFYIKGKKYTIVAQQDVVIANTEGIHYIYFDGSTLTSATSTSVAALFRDFVYVAAIYWDATNSEAIYIGDERHGMVMDWATHYQMHKDDGTVYVSGGGLGDILADESGALATHAQISVGDTDILDEDILLDHAGEIAPASLPVFFKSGATGVWRRTTATTFPAKPFVGGDNRLAYNELSGGSWQQTEVGQGNFVLSHIAATNDLTQPYIVIQGQSTYSNQITAREGAATELNSLVLAGMPFEEFVFLGTIIFQTSTAYANAIQARIRTTDEGDDYVDFRFQKLTPSGGLGDHGSLGGLLDDDHTQYPLLAGRSGDALNIDTINEQTLNAGVTVDGVILKDYTVQADGAFFDDINEKNAGHGVEIDGVLLKDSSIYSGAASIDASAILQLDSTSKGAAFPRMTTAQKAAIAAPLTGLVVYDTDLASLQVYDGASWQTVGSGSGSGGINYILSNDAEDSSGGTTDWTTYADAAAATPVDGTGGAANATWTAQDTNVLRGSKSFRLTKDAVNRQGEGVAYPITIDAQDVNKTLYISFDVETSANYVVDDIDFFVYDITNASLITPRGSVVGGRGTFSFPTSDSTSYRFIIHVASTNASAYTVDFDNFILGPDKLIDSPIVTYMGSYTPQWGAVTIAPDIGNGAITGEYYRMGNRAKIQISIQTGTTTTYGEGAYRFYLPSGLTIDTTKLAITSGGIEVLGTAKARLTAGNNEWSGDAVYFSSGSYIAVYEGDGGVAAAWSEVSPGTPTAARANQFWNLTFEVPILEWANQSAVLSTTEMMNGVAYVEANSSAAQSISDNTISTVVFGTEVKDTHGAYNASTGVFTAPKSGAYSFKTAMQLVGMTPGTGEMIGYFTNNSDTALRQFYNENIVQATHTIGGSADIYLQKDDTVKVRILHNNGSARSLTATASRVYFSVTELPNFSVYGIYGNYERLDAILTSTQETSLADTWTDAEATPTLLPLTAGTWIIGYDVSRMVSERAGAAGDIRANVGIADASDDSIVEGSVSFASSNKFVSGEIDISSASRQTEITITQDTNYKLMIRCSAAAAAVVRIVPTLFTPALTDPDNHSNFWAERKQ